VWLRRSADHGTSKHRFTSTSVALRPPSVPVLLRGRTSARACQSTALHATLLPFLVFPQQVLKCASSVVGYLPLPLPSALEPFAEYIIHSTLTTPAWELQSRNMAEDGTSKHIEQSQPATSLIAMRCRALTVSLLLEAAST
jgi:hypothetical protein